MPLFATVILQLGGRKLKSHTVSSGTDGKRLFTPGAVTVKYPTAGPTKTLSGPNWADSWKLSHGDHIQRSYV